MKKIFEILPSSISEENSMLLIEVSSDGLSFALKNEEQNTFVGVGVYHFEKNTPPIGFPIALQILFHQNECLSQKFKKVSIVYSFPESVLVPFSLYDSNYNREVLNIIHGDLSLNSVVLTDILTGMSTYNCFRVPSSIYEVVNTQYPDASGRHQYSSLLKNEIKSKNKLYLIFYTKKIVVLLIKDGKQQFINSFNYNTAEEIVYILLNICKQFEVANIVLGISGLIEKNSALYNEIYKYFETIELDHLSDKNNYNEEILAHPPHYFSHIFSLASCE